MAAALSLADLSMTDGEPRIRDVRIGERLGMAQPLDIRRTIETNRPELESHGMVRTAREPYRSGNGRVSEATVYWLNEPQTLLLCMFSRTAAAAQVRKEIVEVYMAWRHGPSRASREMVEASEPWERQSRHDLIIRQAVACYVASKTPEFAEAVTHLITAGRSRLPDFWSDIEVRLAMTRLHRQVKIDEAVAVLTDQFGPARTPSRSALGRFWKALDPIRRAQAVGAARADTRRKA